MFPAIRILVLTISGSLVAGCATFSNVRSAEVKKGTSVSVHYTHTGDLGNEATYLWTSGQLDDCNPCSHGVATLDISLRKGIRTPGSPRAYELAVGAAGIMQVYGEAFVGWNQDTRFPYGVGIRVAALSADPEDAGADFRIDGRIDWRVSHRFRVLTSPALFYHRTYRRNESSWLIAATPGIGFEINGENASVTPSFAWIFGSGQRGDRTAAALALEDVGLSAPVFSVTFTFHRAQ